MRPVPYAMGWFFVVVSVGCSADSRSPAGPSAVAATSGTTDVSEGSLPAARGDKVSLCHATGRGRYVPITVSVAAASAHRAHGDAGVGERVPGRPDMEFGDDCAVTSAVPVLTATSGRVTFTDEPGGVRLAGSGFELSFGWWPDPLHDAGAAWWHRCPCAPGTLVDFGDNGRYGVSDRFIVPGRAVIGSVAYEGLFFDGELSFSGPQIMLPPQAGEDTDLLAASGPFTFEGRFFAYADATRTGTPVLSLHVVGSGMATVVFGSFQGRFHLAGEDLVYHFGP
jgi:hypothetical protein